MTCDTIEMKKERIFRLQFKGIVNLNESFSCGCHRFKEKKIRERDSDDESGMC